MNTLKKSPVDKKIIYEGLTKPVTAPELREYRKNYIATPKRLMMMTLIVLPALVFLAVAILILVDNVDATSKIVGAVICLLFGVSATAGIMYGYRQTSSRGVKIVRFAADNGWQFKETVPHPNHAGLIFQQGSNHESQEVIYDTGDATTAGFEIGRHLVKVGSGNNQHSVTWLYCSIELDRHFPHMVLDSAANNVQMFARIAGGNLPAIFDKNNLLELEGDFNTYFKLYAPGEYRRDVHQVFTPELMARLIDHTQTFGAEVIDNRMYLYTRLPARGMTLTDPAFVSKVIAMIEAAA